MSSLFETVLRADCDGVVRYTYPPVSVGDGNADPLMAGALGTQVLLLSLRSDDRSLWGY